MNDVIIELKLVQCESLDQENVIDIVAAIADAGFTIIRNIGGKMRETRSRNQLSEMIAGHYSKVSGAADEWWIGFRIAAHGTAGSVDNANVEITRTKSGQSRISVGALFDPQARDQTSGMLHFGEMIGRLSRKLHSIAKPELTIITHGEGITINPSEVARRELSSIGWINIWGPGFVHERHESLFLNVPGYKTARLKGGSIYHQSAKTMIVQSANEAKSLRKSIVEYFRRNGFAVKYHGSIVLKERKG